MVRVDGATDLWCRVETSTTRECPPGAENAESEDGRRGAVAVAGGGLGVVERVEHVLRAGEGVGVSPGCEIGVGEVVLVPDGLE